MKNTKILNAFSKLGRTAKAKFSKNSPIIFIVGGLVVSGAATISACIATKKASPIVTETKGHVEEIKKAIDFEPSNETEADHIQKGKQLIKLEYKNCAVEMVKLYALPVSLSVVSVLSILAGAKILNDRYVAAAAGYTAVLKEFRDYRNRVKEKYGEEADRLLRYGIEQLEVENESGEVEKANVVHEVYRDPNGYSQYARIFDETNPYWDKSEGYNRAFLISKQNYFNDFLRATPGNFVFLNDIYKELGFPPTKQGQIVGWIYKPDDPTHKGDNCIDFGIIDIRRPKANDFVNGYERSIVLDFNVDGPIIDQI